MPGWIAKEDPTTGKTYYYNKETRETTWKQPTDYVDPAASTVVAPAPASVPATAALATDNDWVAKLDPKSEKMYYYNRKTKETTWEMPASMSTAPAAAATIIPPQADKESESDWVDKLDPKSNKTYYYNRKTKETSWTKPEGFGTAGAATTIVVPSVSEQKQPTHAIESDWIAKLDPKSNNTYYYNHKTKETTWEKPVEHTPTVPTTTPVAVSEHKPAEPVTAATDGWVPKVDEKSGRTYLFNPTTRETKWSDTPPASSVTTPRQTDGQTVDVAATQPTSNDALWLEKTDPAGKIYYVNKATKETSWTKPQAPTNTPPANSNALQPLWVERVDPKSGKTYYFNSKTKETTWTKPASNDTEGSMKQQPSSPLAAPAKPSMQLTNWTKRVDYRTGQFVYHNTVTGETQWTDPSEVQPNLVLPLSADGLFAIGGNERPTAMALEELPRYSTYQSVEVLDGKQWTTLQHSYNKAAPTAPSGMSILPCDLVDITTIRTGRAECIFFGKRATDGTSVCMEWSTETQQCKPRFDLQGLVAYGAAFAPVTLGVIATGGYLDDSMQRVSSDAMIMNIEDPRPHLLPKLNHKRANHAIAVIDLSNSERLLWFAFVFGGFDGERKSASVERYVLGKPSWDVMSDMPVARSGHCAVAVDRTIYVLGGRSGYRVLNDCNSMHVQSDTWRFARPMHQARCNFGAVYVGTFILVVGGWDGTRALASVEAYDPRIDTWRRVCSLPSPKQRVGLVVLRKIQPNGQTVVDAVR